MIISDTPSPVIVAPESASISLSVLSELPGSLLVFVRYTPTKFPSESLIFSSIKLSINQSSVISAPSPAVSDL